MIRCESNARLEHRAGLLLRKCQRSQLVKRAIDRGFNRLGLVWQSKSSDSTWILRMFAESSNLRSTTVVVFSLSSEVRVGHDVFNNGC